MNIANSPTGEMNYSSYKDLELMRVRREFFSPFGDVWLQQENAKIVILRLCEYSVETDHGSSRQKVQWAVD